MISIHQTCLDASTALAFALKDDPLHDIALLLFQTYAAKGMVFRVPAIFAYECDSVLRLQVYKGALTTAQAQIARAAIAALPLIIEYAESDRARAYQIAEQYAQPRAYDAAYASHAEARGLELITADKPFFETVNGTKCPKSVAPLTFVKLLG